MITGTLTSARSGATSASTLDLLLASARAPACGWYPRSAIAAATRSRVAVEMGRRPLNAYETVLVDTPAARATSSIVTTATHCRSTRSEPQRLVRGSAPDKVRKSAVHPVD